MAGGSRRRVSRRQSDRQAVAVGPSDAIVRANVVGSYGW
jgi:hypothetical protein